MKLEELARQSSDAARVSVVHLDPPPLGEKPSRAGWHIPALIGVAALVLVGGIATALLLDDGGGDGGDGESIVAGSQDVPRLGLPELSAWNVAAATDLATFADEVGNGARFEYYGTPGLDDPFAEGGLLIVTMDDPVDEDLAAGGASEVTVRGVAGRAATGAESGGGLPPETNLVQWVESGTGEAIGVVLASRSMTIDQLLAVAEGLELSTDGSGAAMIRPPDDIGLERVTTSSASPLFRSGGLQPGTVGWLVAYERATTDRPASIVLVTAADTLRDVAAEMRFWSTDFESVTVNGAPGVISRSDVEFDGTTTYTATVAWEAAPGAVATLFHAGAEPDVDVAALAETTAVLDDETWTEMLLLAQQTEPPTSDYDVVFGQGSGVLGETTYHWVLGLRADDLCVDIGTGSSGSGSCQPYADLVDENVEFARSIDNMFGEDLVSVVFVASPTVEAIRETSGVGIMERVEAADQSWFVYLGEPGHQPEFDVLVGGEVVDTIEAAVVEGGAAPASIVVADHPSALELGIADDFVAVLGVADPDVSFVVGVVGGETCIVSDAPTSGAWCSDGDIVQLRQLAADPSAPTSLLVVAVSPPCVEGSPSLVNDGVSIGSMGAGGTPTGAVMTAWFVPDAADELTVSVITDDGTRHSVGITDDAAEGALTDVTLLDNASWPETICG